mgnify:CR=1 FL=1
MRSTLRDTFRRARVVAAAAGLLVATCDRRPSSSHADSVAAASGQGPADSVAATVSSSGASASADCSVRKPGVFGEDRLSVR